MTYYIVFGVRGSLAKEVGLSNTYSTEKQAFKAAYACMREINKVIVGFIIMPKHSAPMITEKTIIIGKIINLYPHHYPEATLTKYWKALLFDALYDANLSYVNDMYETMRISAVEGS